MPWRTPGDPADREAACNLLSIPFPAASTPKISTSLSSRKGWNSPSAFEPPPIQATKALGNRFSFSRICFLASSPITYWKSLTIFGYGWGPAAVPII